MTIEKKKWEEVGTFSEGCEVLSSSQVVLDEDLCAWRYTGELPHIANKDSIRIDGIGYGSWVYCYKKNEF